MAIGYGQVLAGHGATAVNAAAAELFALTGGRSDDLIQLSCQVSPDGLATVVLRGDLDLATADQTVRYVTGVIDRHDGPVSADLGGLTFCDACGLGALIRATTHAEQLGRKLELTSPSRAVTRIMRLTGVDDWLLRPALGGLSAAGGPAPCVQRG